MLSGSDTADFPDRLSPVFVRDLRQGLRAHYFVWVFILLQLLSLISTLVEFALIQVIGEGAQGGALSGMFQTVLIITFCGILPLTMFGALQSELGQGRNIELLLTSSLTRWQLVRGKLLVGCSLSSLLLGSLLPYFLIRYFLGSLELTNALMLIGAVVLFNGAANAIVIGASGYANYVGRCAVIFYFLMCLVISLTASFTPMVLSIAGGFGAPEVLSFAATYLCVGLLFIALGLQLGRARVRLFESPIDPPSSVVVFVFVFATPLIVGVAASTGGPIATLVLLSLMILLVVKIDPGASKKNRLKGLQP